MATKKELDKAKKEYDRAKIIAEANREAKKAWEEANPNEFRQQQNEAEARQNKSLRALMQPRAVKEAEAYSIVSLLLDDGELVEMGKNFIAELPIGFYTDILQLKHIDYMVGSFCSPLSFLLSPKQREQFLNENLEYINNTSDEVNAYFIENLCMFNQIWVDHTKLDYTVRRWIEGMTPKQEVFVTYVFIYNIVIEHLAEKWENEYKQYFLDIFELNLDDAIERYFSIDTVVHRDIESIGKFVYYLIKHGKFDNNDRSYLNCWEVVIPKINQILEYKKYNNFVKRLKTSSTNSQTKYTINDVDLMNGLEFEKFIAELFYKMGFESEITKASGDQGIDVIASKNGNTIGIQAKCYSSSVGNNAIQEAVAGKNHYCLDKAIVVTNNFFTDSAQHLAKSNSIILWDRHILKEKIDENFNSPMN